MHKLHPGARWSFRILAYFTFIIFSFILIWFVLPITTFLLSLLDKSEELSLVAILLTIFLYFIFMIIFGEIYARMSYNRWFYEFKDDGLKLERGIIWKRYSNIPYERIQNVDVHRGIIARMLGFSTVMIQTAGFSGGSFAEGNIPAVGMDDAEKIRTFVMHKITKRETLI